MKDNPYSLAAYKKRVKEIKHRKGTAEWLEDFDELARDYGNPGRTRNGKTLITSENLSLQEFVYLRTIIKKLKNGEACGFINKGLFDFLTKYGFDVEPVEIGWIVK